jgi:hypothetical protein
METATEITDILIDIAAECGRQDAKCGANVEAVPSLGRNAVVSGRETPAGFWVLAEEDAKALEQRERARGNESFVATAIEGLSETVTASLLDRNDDGEALEKEVLQLAAVMVKWLQAIRRRRGAKDSEELQRRRMDEIQFAIISEMAHARGISTSVIAKDTSPRERVVKYLESMLQQSEHSAASREGGREAQLMFAGITTFIKHMLSEMERGVI